jgi:aquaporin Z
MNKYLNEFIGTFFFVLTIVVSVNGGAGAMAPIAIGAALMVMIFAGGHISGGHYNPAVTLAVWLRGKCTTAEMPIYMVAQILGGAIAALVSSFLLGSKMTPTPMKLEMLPALLAELLGTFALAWVVLNVATTKATEGNSFYGLAIGFTVTAMAYSLGGISGGAFNPAVAIGVTVAGMQEWANIWIFLVGCFGGGAMAGFAYNFLVEKE